MNLSIMVKNYKGKVCNMYQDEYKRWLAADLEDADLKPELTRIEGNDDEIKDRFAVALKFGTAGLRGVLGAGTNRMNIYVVRQATQGLANWVKTQAQPDRGHQLRQPPEERRLCQDCRRRSGRKRYQGAYL